MWQISTKFDGVGYVMSFSDPKYPNSIRTRYGPRKLRVFHGYFKYRFKPTRIREERPEPEPKISMYLLSPNVYDSKDPDLKGTGLNLTRTPRRTPNRINGWTSIVRLWIIGDVATKSVLLLWLSMSKTMYMWC